MYSRPGCHLCDEMMAVIERVGRGTPFTVDVIDISSDAELEARYGLEIPVLLVNGKKSREVSAVGGGTDPDLARESRWDRSD